MMGHPYQGGRLVATLGWGWLGMVPTNVVTPITTMVKVGGGGPPDARKWSFRPSSKGLGHSMGAHE
jgi:hypothetical protein